MKDYLSYLPELKELLEKEDADSRYYPSVLATNQKQFVLKYKLPELARAKTENLLGKDNLQSAIRCFTENFLVRYDILYDVVNLGLLAYSDNKDKSAIFGSFVSSLMKAELDDDEYKYFDYYSYLLDLIKEHKLSVIYLEDANYLIIYENNNLNLNKDYANELFYNYYLEDYKNVSTKQQIKISNNIKDKVKDISTSLAHDIKLLNKVTVLNSDKIIYLNRLVMLQYLA